MRHWFVYPCLERGTVCYTGALSSRYVTIQTVWTWQLLSVYKFQWDLAAILYATMCSEVSLKFCLKLRKYQRIQSWRNLLMSSNTRLLLSSRKALEQNKLRKCLLPLSSESFCLLPYKEKNTRWRKALDKMEWRRDVWKVFIVYSMNWRRGRKRRQVRKIK
jgi:hypothetical protein